MKVRHHKLGITIYVLLLAGVLIVYPQMPVFVFAAALSVYCIAIFATKPERRCRECGTSFYLTPISFLVILLRALKCGRCGARVKNKHR
ncbi:MAG: hypothetical protein AB3N28_03100 [Kordiimonas sp.]